jgi:hypothetical protein
MGLSETDIYILKNVLETLPKDHFDMDIKNMDVNDQNIQSALLSYKSRKEHLKKSRSLVNLTKQTNMTQFDAVK